MITASKEKAFTIVEILIVITVVAILAITIAVSYNSVQNKAKDSALHSNIKVLHTAIDLYYKQHGAYPRSSPYGASGLNDITGNWPPENMEGITNSVLKSPFDITDSVNSMREEAGWEESGHGTSGKIGYASVIANNLQVKGGPDSHWTCFWSTDVCTGWRIWYRTSDNVLHTLSGGVNPPSIHL